MIYFRKRFISFILNCMSLASIVLMLQTALSLLVLVNSNPSLPQSMRDNAQQVAQQAIAQATAAIAANNAPQTNQTSNATSTVTNQTFTTPSGAVVSADGTVLNAPIPSTVSMPTAPATTPTVVSAANSSPALSISPGQSTVTTNSAYLSWNTNIPANSKVFLTQMPVASYSNSTQVISSDAGYSTLGFANISNLTPNTQYSYTIEAVNGTQDQKLSGVFSTSALPSPPAVDPTIVLDEQTDLTSVANSLANAVCPSSPTIVVRPENDLRVTATVSNNTITSNLPSGTTKTDLDVALADKCGQVSWSYYNSNYSNMPSAATNGWASIGTLHANDIPDGGIGEAAFTDSTSTQTIIITAAEAGGGTSTKTLTGQYNNGVLTVQVTN